MYWSGIGPLVMSEGGIGGVGPGVGAPGGGGPSDDVELAVEGEVEVEEAEVEVEDDEAEVEVALVGTVSRLLVLELAVPALGMNAWIWEKSGTLARCERQSDGRPRA